MIALIILSFPFCAMEAFFNHVKLVSVSDSVFFV